MSGREWKPGDVAMVTGRWEFSEPHSEARAIRLHQGWKSPGCKRIEDYEVSAVRPLVVIDPEDRDQVERLCAEYIRAYGNVQRSVPPKALDDMQAALREFANPTPVKPDEPLDRYAVVVDEVGTEWVRDRVGRWFWTSENGVTTMRGWNFIHVVRVLSEGVRDE